jgi:hypothetical protein
MRGRPAGQRRLDDATRRQLRDLTLALIAAREGVVEEHARFRSIGGRGLCLPEGQLARRLGNATVLVTGETGCIGSALIKQLAARGAGRIVSVSRCYEQLAQVRRRGVPVRAMPGTAPPWTG